MTRCDHGVRFDRYCGDCEAGITFADLDLTDQSTHAAGLWGLFVVICGAGLALIGGVAFVMSRVR